MIKKTFFKFIISGGINTAVTYIVYLLLLDFIGYKLSYTISYILGIVISFLLNKNFVFNSDRGILSVILFPLVYLTQYLIGLFLVWLWITKLELSAEFAPILAIVVTIPVTFLLSRFVFIGLNKKSN